MIMWSRFKKAILTNRYISCIALSIRKNIKNVKLYLSTNKKLRRNKTTAPVIFYLGIPAHANLGDLAQGVCIRRWLKKNYDGTQVIEIETNALVNTHFSVLNKMKRIYKSADIIVFQSGYTTTDLGGYADIMHKAVMQAFPNAKMLMLPQTVFFKTEERKIETSACYNKMNNMLFLARDKVSYDIALSMFPDISVKLYPDIVTTLIGNRAYDYTRDGILFCCRDDGEKFYSDSEVDALIQRCSELCKVEKTDTTKKGKVADIVRNAEEYIDREIDKYARYKAIITDRYHGTILSLVASTPVIIIKTNDHKVTTGAQWFRGIYDDYVYVADSLDEAYELVKEVFAKSLSHKLKPFFETEYYDKLPALFKASSER